MTSLPLFDQPPATRMDHPETTFQAAKGLDLVGHRLRVMAEFINAGQVGRTDLELEAALDYRSARPRRVELERLQLIERTNLRRLTPSRREAVVFVVTPLGREQYQLAIELLAAK